MTRHTPIMAMVAALSITGLAMGAISGTDHDFSSNGWSGGEICKPCHTPHNADLTVADAPLWNHEVTVAAYETHSGTGVTTANALDSESILCMSCHDGTVAIDSFGGATGTNFMGGGELIGTNVSDDHPIGADAIYPAVGSTSYVDQVTGTSHGQPVQKVGALKLKKMDISGIEDVVGCTTCHSPHGKGFDDLLRMSNASSALCLNCHIK